MKVFFVNAGVESVVSTAADVDGKCGGAGNYLPRLERLETVLAAADNNGYIMGAAAGARTLQSVLKFSYHQNSTATCMPVEVLLVQARRRKTATPPPPSLCRSSSFQMLSEGLEAYSPS